MSTSDADRIQRLEAALVIARRVRNSFLEANLKAALAEAGRPVRD